ncbi:MaoC/PaaZ C-terminal domain-containing protein [Marinobacter sp. F4206]|uniref:MaoC/PaaZ C-terminal domain-containing protein n=1 Tax=Marinobacter sp. F4206 TaxID=2861777 RepID=UPI001C5E51F6|nr:MaoC/PaaZ C-terminal domain-containing protein [Marinobacter sp. F4206]MBW4935863.1 MaoC family dehydratase N-terminal domain-containing protein [Marinobacter sp. F4206]
MSDIRQKTLEGLEVGDQFTLTRTFTETETMTFGEISRDHNPIHYDERFVRAKGLQGRICHGLLVGGMITEVGGQIGWLASGMNFRFRRPVYFGDTVTCVFTITEVDDKNRARAEAVLSNQHGDVVIEAWLTGVLPGPVERNILASLLAGD